MSDEDVFEIIILLGGGVGKYIYNLTNVIKSKYGGEIPAVVQLECVVQTLIFLTLVKEVFEGQVVLRVVVYVFTQYLLLHYHCFIVKLRVCYKCRRAVRGV